MARKKLLKILNLFNIALKDLGIKTEKLILYGSHAKKTQRVDSDIDIVVISKDFQKKGYWERNEILTKAIYKVFAPIEAVAMTPKEWKNKNSFVQIYAKDGENISF